MLGFGAKKSGGKPAFTDSGQTALQREGQRTGLKTGHYKEEDAGLKPVLRKTKSRSLITVRDEVYARLPRARARPGSG